MTWDAAKPAGSQKLRLSDDEIRDNWAALEAALAAEHQFPNTGNDGQHKFPVAGATPAGLEGRVAIVNDNWYWYSNAAWRTLIPPGTKMVFLQAEAPTGWTQDASLNDKVLAQWLKKNRVDTIQGRLRFDNTNNYGDDLMRVKQVQNGRWVTVWPKEWAAPGAKLLTP